MISAEQLEAMGQRLADYDVRDGGWVHEGMGLTTNLSHVYMHLSGVIIRKNFGDAEVIRNEVTPDSLQYALRFGRWTNRDIGELMMPDEFSDAPTDIEAVPETRRDYLAVKSAAQKLYPIAHDAQHGEQAPQWLLTTAASFAAGRLLESVLDQADMFGFDIEESFDHRLAQLREDFGVIPKI